MSNDPFANFPPDHTERLSTADALRMLMGGPVALVTTIWRGVPNVMPLAWYMPVSVKPALIAIAVAQERYTAELISHAQEFALNFPKRPYLHHVQYLGGLRGENIDKFEATQWETFIPTRISAPLLLNCAGWIECEVVEVQPIGDHIIFIGEVVAARVDPQSFDPELREWRMGEEDDRVLHFLGGNHYSTLSQRQEARLPRDAEAPERILRERVAEELELTREARERREERVEALRDEVRRGNIVDVDELELSDLSAIVGEDNTLDLSRGIVLPDPDSDRR